MSGGDKETRGKGVEEVVVAGGLGPRGDADGGLDSGIVTGGEGGRGDMGRDE